jgi:hypothetical protein
MTIRENIRAKMNAIAVEVEAGAEIPVSKKLKEMGINAILGGAKDWLAYMNLFAGGPGELARLIPTDGTENDVEKQEARAYLVANSVCAPGTAGALENTVFDKLDYVLPALAVQPAPAAPAQADPVEPAQANFVAGDPPPAAPVGSNS